MYKAKILVVEDDPAISNLIRTTLETQDYQFHTAQNGSGALMEAVSYNPDVMILDLGLPDMDGVDIIKKDRDKVEALDAGADDYLTKPFSIEEFLARLRAALRRSHTEAKAGEESSLYTNGDLTIDFAAGCAYVKGEEIHLTPIEYKLLCLLAQNTGKVLTHNHILKEVWGGAQASDIPSLRVFMATLRKKIEQHPDSPRYIQTHVGVGYRMLRQ